LISIKGGETLFLKGEITMKTTDRKRTIAFDADDTLWPNESFYRGAEKKFCRIMSKYVPEQEAFQKLFETEVKNNELFGYGGKGFTLSMIETAIALSNSQVPASSIQDILNAGKSVMDYQIEILPGVKEVLKYLQGKYNIIVVTKGDLKDQERKFKKSGLSEYFQNLKILSNKNDEDYKKLLQKLNVKPDDFLMIGNSMKSDIIPVLNIGAYAIHIPFHTTWIHETAVDEKITSSKFFETDEISQIIEIIEKNFPQI